MKLKKVISLVLGVMALSMLTACGSSTVTTDSSVVDLVNSKMKTADIGESQKSWTITSKASDEQLVYNAITDETLFSQDLTIGEIRSYGGLDGYCWHTNNNTQKIWDAGAVTELCIYKADNDKNDLADEIITYMELAYIKAPQFGDEDNNYWVSCIENISVFNITHSDTAISVAADGTDDDGEYWYIVLTACDEPAQYSYSGDNKYSVVD